MPNGPVTYSWLSLPFYAPLSGSVSQDISPVLYCGNPEIEAEIIREKASFGRQLGIISEAVAALADRLDALEDPDAPGMRASLDKAGKRIDKLRTLVSDVDIIKTRNKAALRREAERALERLRQVDKPGYDLVLRRQGR